MAAGARIDVKASQSGLRFEPGAEIADAPRTLNA